MREIEIRSKSEILSATIFEGNGNKTIVIIASATGVKQEFYRKFAEFCASNDTTVITFDYSGIGRSLKRPIREVETNAAEWGGNDLESICKYAILNYPKSKKVVLGHSIGGQLIGLAESSILMDKIILVASQSGYWKHWNGFGRIKMWFNWYILFPLIIKIFGYLKSKKISGMENLPKNVANQWRNWGKHKDYILGDTSIKETYYDKINIDISAYSIEGDDFAPKEAVKWMSEKYCNANLKSTNLKPSNFQVSKIGHFGVFHDRFQNTIWKQILTEMND